MTNRTQSGFFVLMLAAGLTGCSDAPWSPTVPSTILVQQTAPPTPSGPATSMVEVTLSGVVYEVTPTGMVPLEGVDVYCEPCGAETHTWAYTDSNGFYSFFGVWLDAVPTRIWVGKDGFADPPGLRTPTPPNPSGPGWREVRVDGDTRFDIQLVRR
jgi:hypothetical protein